jgi:hypothetical protein
MTPGNHSSSPQRSDLTATHAIQPSWTPPPKLDQTQPQIRLTWNGHVKADYQVEYEEGLEDARSGRADKAETKFRSTLEGFHHLLSATHPETVSIAYQLASLFAVQSRMQEADTVIDWLNQAHLEDFGIHHARTWDHVFNVCDMFRNWGRPEQAAELLEQFLHEADKKPRKLDSDFRDTSQYTTRTSNRNTTNSHEAENDILSSIPCEGSLTPSALQTRISHLTRVGRESEGALKPFYFD